MKKKGMAKGGIRRMSKGGAAGGRMVPDPAVEELNPGKVIDVTMMADGGFMEEKAVMKMMGGGRPKGMAKGGYAGGKKVR